MYKSMRGSAAVTLVAVILTLVALSGVGWYLAKGSLDKLAMQPTETKAEAEIPAKPLRVGIFPRRNITTSIQAFTPLVEYLGQELGVPVELDVPRNFNLFWKGVKEGQFDLVHYNQYHYIKSHKEQGYQVLVANEEQGRKTIAGALTVRADSGIKDVKDLKGKTIIFGGGRKAMGSYIAPTSLLKKAGLTAETDYRVMFSKNPPGAVINVARHIADAAGHGDVVLELKAVTGKVDTSELKMIATTKPFVHLPWAVSKAVPQPQANRIQQLMVGLKDTATGKDILKKAKVTGFYAVTDKDFDEVREIVSFAVGETY